MLNQLIERKQPNSSMTCPAKMGNNEFKKLEKIWLWENINVDIPYFTKQLNRTLKNRYVKNIYPSPFFPGSKKLNKYYR